MDNKFEQTTELEILEFNSDDISIGHFLPSYISIDYPIFMKPITLYSKDNSIAEYEIFINDHRLRVLSGLAIGISEQIRDEEKALLKKFFNLVIYKYLNDGELNVRMNSGICEIIMSLTEEIEQSNLFISHSVHTEGLTLND